jgi:hypothetical protein
VIREGRDPFVVVEIRPWRGSTSTTGWSRGTRTDLVVALVLDGSSAVGTKRVSGRHCMSVRVRVLMQAGNKEREEVVVVCCLGADKTVQSCDAGI